MTWLDDCHKAAMELTRDKRQEFLNMIRRGLTLGEACRACNVTFDAANGIMQMNIVENSFLSLGEVSK